MLPLLLACAGEKGGESAAPATDDTATTGVRSFLLADDLPGGPLLAAWSSPTEAILVGGRLDGSTGTLVRYDGTSLCYDEGFAPHTLWGVGGAADGGWYAVGAEGTIVRSAPDGTVSDESVVSTATFRSVHDDGTYVHAVGGDPDTGAGEVWRRDGGVWSLWATLPETLHGVWNNWFVGEGVAYVVVDGALREESPLDAPSLVGVTGRSPTDVYAAGGNPGPFLAWFDGVGWLDVPVDSPCATSPLEGVWTSPTDHIWVAGRYGTIARFSPEGWSCEETITNADLRGITLMGFERLFVGGDLSDPTVDRGTIVVFPSRESVPIPGPCP